MNGHVNDIADEPLVAGLSERGWTIGLYLEHLEEASFLYEQRLGLLDDPEVTWQDVEDFEQRFEAHVDALVLGADLALAVCRQQAREGDAGELHAAVRVFCRWDRRALVQEALEALDPSDDEGVQAAAEALCHELPGPWTAAVMDWLGREPHLARLAARVAGYRRIAAGAYLEAWLHDDVPGVWPAVIWALGRLRHQPARSALYDRGLRHGEAAVREAAARALLRMGEPQTVPFCRSLMRTEPWALLAVGLGGSQADVSAVLSVATSDHVNAESLLALGLLGDSSAAEVLLVRLREGVHPDTAATALYLITGASLFEEAFIPDEIDEDALFEDELERLRRGESLTPPGERPPGTTVVRLSQDAEVWHGWWIKHQKQFRPGVRYRHGRPCTPAGLLETLTVESNLHAVRRLAAEELVIRYGVDVPLEVDLPVVQQHDALARCSAWIQQHAAAFQPGKWYLGGRPAT